MKNTLKLFLLTLALNVWSQQATILNEPKYSFGDADGTMGLAYHELNRAFDLTDYLETNAFDPCKTFPWQLAHEEQDDSVREFKKFLKQ